MQIVKGWEESITHAHTQHHRKPIAHMPPRPFGSGSIFFVARVSLISIAHNRQASDMLRFKHISEPATIAASSACKALSERARSIGARARARAVVAELKFRSLLAVFLTVSTTAKLAEVYTMHAFWKHWARERLREGEKAWRTTPKRARWSRPTAPAPPLCLFEKKRESARLGSFTVPVCSDPRVPPVPTCPSQRCRQFRAGF